MNCLELFTVTDTAAECEIDDWEEKLRYYLNSIMIAMQYATDDLDEIENSRKLHRNFVIRVSDWKIFDHVTARHLILWQYKPG